jgi:hypothetical protein
MCASAARAEFHAECCSGLFPSNRRHVTDEGHRRARQLAGLEPGFVAIPQRAVTPAIMLAQQQTDEVEGLVDGMEDGSGLDEAVVALSVEPGKVAHEDRVGPHHLADGDAWIGGTHWPHGTPAEIDQFVQQEALIAEEDLEVAEERLAAIERNELRLGFSPMVSNRLMMAGSGSNSEEQPG